MLHAPEVGVIQAHQGSRDLTAIIGPDVSHYQGTVDWAAVQGAAPFAFAKASQGTGFVDPMFARNWQAMRAAGLIRGAYHFLDDTGGGSAQAEHYLGVMESAGGFEEGDLPPVLDFEDGRLSAARAWIAAVGKATGGLVLLYGGIYYRTAVARAGLEGEAQKAGASYLWVPHYGLASFQWDDVPSGWDRAEVLFWQYTNGVTNGTSWPKSIPGIGTCDVNAFLAGSLDDLREITGGGDMGLKDYTDGWDAFVAGSELSPEASADFKKGYRAARFASTNPKPGAHTHEPKDIPHVHPQQGQTGLPELPPQG